MNNFDHAVEATETALNSAGSATEENGRYMEGLEAKIQAVKASFEALSNTVLDSGLISGVLDLGKAFLDLSNNDLGAFLIRTGLITGVLWGGTGLIKAMKLVSAALVGVGTAAGSAATGVTLFGTAINVSFPWLLAIGAALAAIIAIAPKVSSWYKETTNDVDYANEKLEENETQLKNNKQRLEELSKVPSSNRTSDIDEEIRALKEENAELEKNIKRWNDKAALGALEDVREGQYYGKAYKIFTTDNEMVSGAFGRALDYYIQSEKEAIEFLKEHNFVAKDFNGTLEEAGYKLISFSDSLLDSDEYFASAISQQKEFIQNTRSGTEATADEKKAADERNKALQDYYQVLLNAPYEELTSLEKENLHAIKNLGFEYDSILKTLYPVEESLQILSRGMALNEQQVEVLAKSYPQLAEALEETAGGYILNTDNLYSLAQAGNETARKMVKDQAELTRITLEEIRKRIEAYKEEQRVLRNTTTTNVSDAKQEQILSQKYLADIAKYDEALAKLKTLEGQIAGWDIDPDRVEKSSKKTTDPFEEQNKLFQERIKTLEHELFLMEKLEASDTDRIAKIKEIQKELNAQANWFREQGLDDNSKYIRELQEQWWNYEKEINSINSQAFQDRLNISEQYIEDRNFYNDWGADNEIAAWNRVLVWMEEEYYKKGLISFQEYVDTRNEIMKKIHTAEQEAAKEAERAAEEARQATIDALKDQANAYETAFNYMVNQIQKEIDLLERQRDTEEQYWDDKIAALQAENDEIERQIQLEQLQENLARARQTNVLVYKDGEFQYVQDVDAVNKAQAELESYKREEALNQEVENLRKLKEQALASIDEQIAGWVKYKEEWSSVVDNYQEEQDRLIAEQVLGIKLEGENWRLRLDNLSQYVAEYETLMGRLAEAQFGANAGFGSTGTIGGGGRGGGGGADVYDESGVKVGGWGTNKGDVDAFVAGGGDIDAWVKGNEGYVDPSLIGYAKSLKNKNKHANGTLSAPGGLSLVGEQGPELRVLGQGDGIIPSDITKNLWAWGSMSPSSLLNSLGTAGGISMSGVNMSFPNVRNGSDAKDFMTNVVNLAYQRAYKRA